MSDHPLVLFGCGNLGIAVAENLGSRGFDFLLAGADAECVAAARAKGFEAVEVDYRDDDALRAVGIGGGARLIFCLYDEPSRNLFLTLSARALAPELRIISVCESAESGSKLIAAGADKTIDPYLLTARWIHDLIRRPLILETLQRTLFGEANNLELAEIAVTSASVLAGKRLGELDLEGYNLLLMGVVDRAMGSDLIFRASGVDHQLVGGDILVLIGPDEEIRRFRADIKGEAPAGV